MAGLRRALILTALACTTAVAGQTLRAEAQGLQAPGVEAQDPQAGAREPPALRPVTLQFEKTYFETILRRFSALSGITVVASKEALASVPLLSIELRDVSVQDGLARLVQASGLTMHRAHGAGAALAPGNIVYLVSREQAASVRQDDMLIADLVLTGGREAGGVLVAAGPEAVVLETPIGRFTYRWALVQSARYRHMAPADYHESMGDYWAGLLWDNYDRDDEFTFILRRAIEQYKKALHLDPGLRPVEEKLARLETEEREWQKKMLERLHVRKVEEELRKLQLETDLLKKQARGLEKEAEASERLQEKLEELSNRLEALEKQIRLTAVEVGRLRQHMDERMDAIEDELERSLRRYGLYYRHP